MVSTRTGEYRARVDAAAEVPDVVNQGLLVFEGVLAFGARDVEEAEHFFEHTLGLSPAEVEGEVRFYALTDSLALAIDTNGGFAEMPPYLLFSSPDLEAAREHFVRRGCHIVEMDTAGSEAAGFFAQAPEGHTVCVVDQRSLEQDDTL